ncbi:MULTISPECIES: YlmC/YmxH family sporulation protein [Clostridium]|uniref:YlmC/YmxH family sporulation protein n=1 Tax=Clostridium senegalense TaxID=1465809 RepID=A0A6M0H0F1_9CLOT|nr:MULTISPECIES: YlmC/YmxH family sporulation protein [Clostridium]MBU5225531.1 YlmC/YmxH family sporulation protein [Clostridium senegalense]NEU03351.1 YlmC/YmxH family sporulation protein [Clostridium senegalense]
MEENIKYLSEMERYEIININDGDKYNFLANNDIVIDEQGVLKLLLLNENKSGFSFLKSNGLMEVPWEHVKKIGSRTIIIDVEDEVLKRSHI